VRSVTKPTRRELQDCNRCKQHPDAAVRAALEEYTRERVPLDWAITQNNLGTAFGHFRARESGTARLEEAVAAYRAGWRSGRASACRSIARRQNKIWRVPFSC
jgi:hypothetical protein